MSKQEERLKTTLAQALGCPAASIVETSSTDTVESWNSLAHLNLILALEEEFQVRFLPAETTEMLSYSAIRDTLVRHNVNFED